MKNCDYMILKQYSVMFCLQWHCKDSKFPEDKTAFLIIYFNNAYVSELHWRGRYITDKIFLKLNLVGLSRWGIIIFTCLQNYISGTAEMVYSAELVSSITGCGTKIKQNTRILTIWASMDVPFIVDFKWCLVSFSNIYCN